MHTNVVSFIFLLVFLKNVASEPKLFVVYSMNKGSDDYRQVKLSEDLELIRAIDEHHKLQKAPYRDLDKFDKTGHKYANNDEPEFYYDEQETFKVYNCQSLRPKDIRECLENNLKVVKGQRHKDGMAGLDVFENIKTPDECMALDARTFVQLQCLAKFKNQPTDNKSFKNSEEPESVNVRDPEDCWNLKNSRMSKKLSCLKKMYKKKDKTYDDEFKNYDSNDCLSLKTSMHRKLRCLDILKKNKVTDDIIIYDNFENIKDPNECLFLKKANKLECLEKFEKKNVIDDKLEKVTDPTNCLSLKSTLTNKYECLDKFGKANNEDDEVVVLEEDFDNIKEPNDCLFLKETIERKLKCLDKFPKEEMTQKAKVMTILTANTELRTENDKDIKGPEDCFFTYKSYDKKLKCLDKFVTNKNIFRSKSIESSQQFIARPKRKIYSLYNYYNAVVKPAGFKDLTRQEFSQDYLDISELSRSVPKCRTPACNLDLMKLRYTVNEKKPNLINNSRRFFDTLLTRYIQADSDDSSGEIESPKPPIRKAQKKMKGVPIRFTVVSKDQKDTDYEDDVSEESFEDEQDSDEVHQVIKKKKQSLKKKQKSTTEENAKKSFALFESQEDGDMGISDESESPKKNKGKNKKKKPKKTHVNDDYSIETERPSSYKYSYLQGNNVVDYFRRRLEHFLPKRFHWDEKEFTNLGYYWHDGPRGRWSK